VDMSMNTELHPIVGATMGFTVFKQKSSTLARGDGNGVGVTLIAPFELVVGDPILEPKSKS
jgi:hypothetical protein